MMEVLLVDDHDLVNAGLTALLAETGQFSVSGRARTLACAKSFIEKAAQENGEKMPALVILDVQLGRDNGLEFIPFLKDFCRAKRVKAPPVLVCSILEDPFLMRLALDMGATSYVPKSQGNEELLGAIRAACHGREYVPYEHSAKMLDISDAYDLFTKREKVALALLRQGMSNPQIAASMGICKRTVNNIISNIYIKTGAENRAGLMEM